MYPKPRPFWCKPVGRLRGSLKVGTSWQPTAVSSQDYELQLVTYKVQLEPVASPAKKPKVQSGSESVIQEVWLGPPETSWGRPWGMRLRAELTPCASPLLSPSTWICAHATAS